MQSLDEIQGVTLTTNTEPLDAADIPLAFLESLAGQEVRLTLVAVQVEQRLNKATGVTEPKWNWSWQADDGRIIKNLSSPSLDVRSKATKWLAALNGGKRPEGGKLGDFIGKSVIATLVLKPNSDGFLIIPMAVRPCVSKAVGESIEPAVKPHASVAGRPITDQQLKVIQSAASDAGMSWDALGALMIQVSGKRYEADMTREDGERVLAAVEQHRDPGMGDWFASQEPSRASAGSAA